MYRRIFLVLVLCLVVLVSCSVKEDDDSNIAIFTMLYNDINESPYQENWKIFEVYKNEKNVMFDITLGDNDDYQKAIDLNIKAENPPDIILKCWPEAIEGYAKDGLLLPISEYEYLMPNYRAYIERNQLKSEIDKLKLSNGEYYIIPGFQRSLQVQQWIYRRDIFIENNLNIPTTYDELFDSLVLLKEKYPESTPITASWGGAHLFSMMGAGYGIPAGWSGARFFDEENDIWKFSPATNNYRELYRFLNKCYLAGILDPNIFEQSNEDFTEKLVNGKAFVTVTWITSGFDTWNEQLKQNGISEGKWEALPVLKSTIGIKALPPVNKFRKGLVISANAANKPYFEEMIRFLDWAVYSEDGMDLTYWGIEGLTYTQSTNGKEFLSDINTSKNLLGTTILSKEYGFDSIFNLCENEEFEDYKKPEDIVMFLSDSEKANETLTITPELKLEDDAIEIVNKINEELLIYVDEESKKFITGELNIDTDWDQYIIDMNNIGYTIVEKIWNNAWID